MKSPELIEQKKVVRWLKIQQGLGRVLKYTSVNATPWKSSYSQINIDKASGMIKGFPDLVICLPASIVFLEMKKADGVPSDIKPEQKEWQKILGGYPSCSSHVAFGAEDAINYLSTLIPDVSIPKRAEETQQETDLRIDSFSAFLARE